MAPTRLTGQDPFPRLEDWRADGAMFAYQNLLARKERDADDGGLVESFAAMGREQWTRTLLEPAVFAFVGKEPREWAWSELAAHLREGYCPRDAHGVVVAAAPGPIFTQLLRRLGRGSRAESCANASFLDLDGDRQRAAITSLAAGVELLRSCTPGYFADVQAVVDCVAFVDEKASFRGSSGVIHRGMVFLSPDETWTPGIFAEELLHEATHNLLDLISLRTPLIAGTDVFDEKYAAPFRPDKRHVYGNLHALVVVSRLIHLFGSLRNSPAAEEVDWDARATDYARLSLEPLESVAAHPGLGAASRYLITHLVQPTITVAAA